MDAPVLPRLSGQRVRLRLFALTYNLGNSLRQTVLPQVLLHWTLTTFLEKLIKTGRRSRAIPGRHLPDSGGGSPARVVPGYTGRELDG